MGQVFRLEESIRDDRYVIRAELPGLDPGNDIEVTVDGRILTIRAERRQQDKGPYRSEFRYGSLARAVRLPAGVDPRTSPPGTTRASWRSASPPGRSSRKAPGSPSRMPTRCPGSPLTGPRCPGSPLTRPDDEPARAGRGWVITPWTGTAAAPPARPRSS